MKNEMFTKSMELGLVQVGRKGVTNKQMLDTFKCIGSLEKEEIIQLLKDYPQVFMSSIKYTPDVTKVALEKLVKENGYPEFTVKTGKKIKYAEPEVKSNIIVLDTYKNKNNEKMAQMAKKFEILSDDEKAIVKEMVEKDLGISELAKEFGLTKDQAYNRIFRAKGSIYNKLAAN